MKKVIVKNISKRFRVLNKDLWALKNISLNIDKGEKLCIIGKNGAGKSTLLRVIAKVYKETNGTVQTNGKIVSIFGNNIGLHDNISVKDNIFLFCSIHGLTKREIKNKLNKILEFSELKEYSSTMFYKLSEGMKQRLVLSMISECNPEILIFDDANTMIDKDFEKKYIELAEEKRKQGLTTIYTTHSNETTKRCNKIVWMENGKIIKIGGQEVAKEYFKQSPNHRKV